MNLEKYDKYKSNVKEIDTIFEGNEKVQNKGNVELMLYLELIKKIDQN